VLDQYGSGICLVPFKFKNNALFTISNKSFGETLDSVCTVYGQCLGSVWIGHFTVSVKYMGSVWAVSGWSLEGVWAVSGQCLGSIWAVSGQCLGSIWAVSGECLGSVWRVSGECLESI
jgi:hypothetical protein